MDIGIIGGGISGMILASKLNKHNVTILESNNRLGKKLLLTGNGKCNFTNMDFKNLDYIYNCELAKKLFTKHNNISFINYLYKLGIVPKIEVHKTISYIYPNNNKASSVYYALYDRILFNNITINYDELVTKVYKENNKFVVIAKNKYHFDKLIFATGGVSYTKNDEATSALLCIESLGHKIIKLSPGLTPLKFNIKDVNLNKYNFNGFRVDARVSFIDGDKVHYEYGEIQFTKSNLSGIPILNMSNKLSKSLYNENKNIELHIDFSNALINDKFINTTQIDNKEVYNTMKFSEYINGIENKLSFVEKILQDRKNVLYYRNVKDFLCGFLPDELNSIIFFLLKFKNKEVRDLSMNNIKELAKLIIDFKVQINKNLKFDDAQITIGGINTCEVNSDTLESKFVSGLYIIGEALDIDGICGGYNIQMAYSSATTVADVLLSMEE